MKRWVSRRTEKGASSVEYALLAALIALAIIGAVAFFGSQTRDLFQNSCESLTQSTQASSCS